MLIDPHLNPHDLSPTELIDRMIEASLDGAVITFTHSAERAASYLEALEEEEFVCFIGVELNTSHGQLVLIPEQADEAFLSQQWAPSEAEREIIEGEVYWKLEALEPRLKSHQGVVILTHPYSRLTNRTWGDRAFTLDWVDAAETRIGRGLAHRDFLSDQVTGLKGWARVGSSSGDSQQLGSAATVVAEDIETQEALCTALRGRVCWPIEFEDPMFPRARYQGVVADAGPRRRTLEERERREALERVARSRGHHVEEEVSQYRAGGRWGLKTQTGKPRGPGRNQGSGRGREGHQSRGDRERGPSSRSKGKRDSSQRAPR